MSLLCNTTIIIMHYSLSLHDALPISIIVDINSGKRIDPDRNRGVRVSHFDWNKSSIQKWPKDLLGIYSERRDRKSTRLNSSHVAISYAVFCLKKKKKQTKENKHINAC